MSKVKIEPVNNAKIRDPLTKKHLRPEGELLVLNSFWMRRILSGEARIIKTETESSQGEQK